jgi:hypothetical protein
VGRGSDCAVPNFCVKVAFKDEVVEHGAFCDGCSGWGSDGCGGMGVIIAGAAGVVISISAEMVAIFGNEGMSGEELEAIAEGSPGVVGEDSLDEGWWGG